MSIIYFGTFWCDNKANIFRKMGQGLSAQFSCSLALVEFPEILFILACMLNSQSIGQMRMNSFIERTEISLAIQQTIIAEYLLTYLYVGRDVTTGKIQVQPLQWWAKSAPHGWDRVKVSEKIGATAVAPVAPADTSLVGIHKNKT